MGDQSPLPAPPAPGASEAWLTFAGPIDNQAFGRLCNHMAQVVQCKFARIHLLIQSAGGVVGDGIAMYNLLRGLPVEIVTYNCGATESIAMMPYLAGKIRRTSKTATFMIHRTMCAVPLGATAKDLRARAESFDLYDANVEQILRETLEMPDEKWAIHGTRDLLISAEEALSFKVAHEISDFALPPGAPFVNV